MAKPVVAHFIQDYLKPTTNWIHGQITANDRYEPLVLAKRVMNLELFKVKNIVSLDQLPSGVRLLNNINYRLRGFHPAYLKTCREMSVSLLHAHFGHIGYKALGLKAKLGVPLITTFYGYDVSALGRIPRYRRRFERLFAQGEMFLAEGPHLAQCLSDLGCPEKKIRIFHLGVHIDSYRFQERQETDEIRVLFAATLTDKKGWEDALDAFSAASDVDPRLRLRLIGAGEDEARVRERIAARGLQAHVTLSGYVPHQQLLEEMQKADIFLQPSRTAKNGNTEGGAPVTLIDAQATGLAICATTHADIPEVAPHEVSALLSPEREVQSLTANLLRLAADQSLRARLGKAGRARVESDYNWQIQGLRQAALYDSLL